MEKRSIYELLEKLEEIKEKIDETSCELGFDNKGEAEIALSATNDIKHARFYISSAIDKLVFIDNFKEVTKK